MDAKSGAFLKWWYHCIENDGFQYSNCLIFGMIWGYLGYFKKSQNIQKSFWVVDLFVVAPRSVARSQSARPLERWRLARPGQKRAKNHGKIIVATCSMGDFPPRVWFEYQRVSRKHEILIEVGSLATLCWWSRRHQLSSWPWQHQKIYQYDGNIITFHHLPSPTIQLPSPTITNHHQPSPSITNHPTSRIFPMDFWLRIGGIIAFCSKQRVSEVMEALGPIAKDEATGMERVEVGPCGLMIWGFWRVMFFFFFLWYKYKWYIYIRISKSHPIPLSYFPHFHILWSQIWWSHILVFLSPTINVVSVCFWVAVFHCGTPHESSPTRDFLRAFWHCSVDHVPPFWPKLHFLFIFWSFKHITILGYRVGIHQGFSRFFQADLHLFLHSGEGFELREAGLCDAEGEPGHHFSAGGVKSPLRWWEFPWEFPWDGGSGTDFSILSIATTFLGQSQRTTLVTQTRAPNQLTILFFSYTGLFCGFSTGSSDSDWRR